MCIFREQRLNCTINEESQFLNEINEANKELPPPVSINSVNIIYEDVINSQIIWRKLIILKPLGAFRVYFNK